MFPKIVGFSLQELKPLKGPQPNVMPEGPPAGRNNKTKQCLWPVHG
jgi:hypothetical protein